MRDMLSPTDLQTARDLIAKSNVAAKPAVKRLVTWLDRINEGRRAYPTPAMNEERYVSTGEAAELLGVRSVNTVKRWLREGKLEGRKKGARYEITMSSIRDFLRRGEAELVREQESYAEFKRELARDTLDLDLDPDAMAEELRRDL